MAGVLQTGGTAAGVGILSGDLVEGAANAHVAPALVDTQIADDVRHILPGRILAHLAIQPKGDAESVGFASLVTRNLGSNRAGKAVAEILCVAGLHNAIVIGSARGLGVG